MFTILHKVKKLHHRYQQSKRPCGLAAGAGTNPSPPPDSWYFSGFFGDDEEFDPRTDFREFERIESKFYIDGYVQAIDFNCKIPELEVNANIIFCHQRPRKNSMYSFTPTRQGGVLAQSTAGGYFRQLHICDIDETVKNQLVEAQKSGQRIEIEGYAYRIKFLDREFDKTHFNGWGKDKYCPVVCIENVTLINEVRRVAQSV